MAWIQVIPEDEAEGRLKEYYDRIQDARGKIANIMRVHSLERVNVRGEVRMDKRCKFTSQFQAKVVLKLLSGAKPPAQVCREYATRIAELERMVGRLVVELDAKKAWQLVRSPRTGSGRGDQCESWD